MEQKKSVFQTLNEINCNEHTETKNAGYSKLTYLSWAWAWQICKQNYPDANYKVYENEKGWNYFSDGRTAWVKTGVIIEGQEHIEYLPVMDSRNKSIPVEDVTSFDVNKAIQRSLTKALARHGLGLYIYAGEDLPDAADDTAREEVKQARKVKPIAVGGKLTDENYWKIVRAHANGKVSKTGGDYRQTWIENFKPSQDEIAKFDSDVEGYKAAQAGNALL